MRKFNRITSILLAGAAFFYPPVGSGAPAPFPRTTRQDKPSLVGVWKQAFWEGSGYLDQASDGQRWEISPTTIVIRFDDGVPDHYEYRLDEYSSPPTIDLIPRAGNRHPDPYWGVFELTRGALKLARSNSHRPARPGAVGQGEQRSVFVPATEKERTK